MARSKHRQDKRDQFTMMTRVLMQTDAWRSLSTTAQALYPWVRLEWKGSKVNNNGKISLSVRQAAERMGVSKDTAARAFQELQAKGFLHVKETASLGVHGHGRCFKYEITEISLVPARDGRFLYKTWTKDNDFEVVKAVPANPRGRRTKTLHKPSDSPIIEFKTLRAIPSSG